MNAAPEITLPQRTKGSVRHADIPLSYLAVAMSTNEIPAQIEYSLRLLGGRRRRAAVAMPSQSAELMAGRARLAAVALLLAVTCFSSQQVYRLVDDAALPGEVEALQTSFQARSSERLFSILSYHYHKDCNIFAKESCAEQARQEEAKIQHEKTIAGAGVVLPLEREAKSFEAGLQSAEGDVEKTLEFFGAVPKSKGKNKEEYRKPCNIFSGEGCDLDYDGEGQEEKKKKT
eukprot:1733191-Rhodomonas_salina.1